MLLFTLYVITTILSIAFIWAIDGGLNWKQNIILSLGLCFLPFISFIAVLITIFVGWVVDSPVKFKPIPNLFKYISLKKQTDNLPKCEFSKFIKYHSVFSTLNPEQTYLRTLSYNTSNSRLNKYFYELKSLFDDHRKSQYYKGSLLGSLERTFILWLDNIYEVDFKKASRSYDIKFKLKQNITDEHIKFLNELIEATKIPYEWINQQEYRDRKEEEKNKREQSDRLNHEFSEVVKSMKTDLEKIYSKKEGK